MGSIEIIHDEFPHQPAILATTSHGAYKPSNNHVIQTGVGQSQFGWLQKGQLLINEQKDLEHLLETLLSPAIRVDNMHKALWKKLAVNASINPMTAAMKCRNGKLKERQHLETIKSISREISEVATAQGILLSASELYENTCQVVEDTADNYSSMYQDVQASRKTEIEFISGYVVGLAKKSNIFVPETELWLEKVREIEAQYLSHH